MPKAKDNPFSYEWNGIYLDCNREFIDDEFKHHFRLYSYIKGYDDNDDVVLFIDRDTLHNEITGGSETVYEIGTDRLNLIDESELKETFESLETNIINHLSEKEKEMMEQNNF